MMTGAILGGASISQAVKYQQIIMFLISATTTLAVTLSVVISLVVCIDGNHRLRPDRVSLEKAWTSKLRDSVISVCLRAFRIARRATTLQSRDEEAENHIENRVPRNYS